MKLLTMIALMLSMSAFTQAATKAEKKAIRKECKAQFHTKEEVKKCIAEKSAK